ncbi:hypothetical protein OC835_007916, partial [Tilletia horrida]
SGSDGPEMRASSEFSANSMSLSSRAEGRSSTRASLNASGRQQSTRGGRRIHVVPRGPLIPSRPAAHPVRLVPPVQLSPA